MAGVSARWALAVSAPGGPVMRPKGALMASAPGLKLKLRWRNPHDLADNLRYSDTWRNAD